MTRVGKVFPISPSSLLDFEGCPKRYYHTKIVKTHKSGVTDAITHGNVVHEQLEMYVKQGQVLPSHLEHVKPILEGLTAAGFTLHAELEMAIDRNWHPVSFWDSDGYLRGKVDLVALNATSGTALVFDYKTGKRKPDTTQLKIYGAVLYHVLRLRRVESWYLWLKTREDDKFVIDPGNIAIVQNEITERIENVNITDQSGDFPAKTSPLCMWCPVLEDCPDAIYWKEKKRNKRT